MLERLFHLSEHGTTLATEVRAGVTTFLTLSYILFVNPQILGAAGMPPEDVAIATALASAVATAAMALLARYPVALAPGMGLNAYFTYGVVLGLGIDWRVALAAVFVEGLLFLALALGGVRRAIVDAIPMTLKVATMTGIGLFLGMIGLQGAGLVVAHPETLVTLGEVRSPAVLVALAGLLVSAVLMALKVRGAILAGIAATAALAWAAGLASLPERLVSLPRLPRETFLAMDFGGLLSAGAIVVVLAFLFVDLFDTAGTLIGVGRLGGFLEPDGSLPRADRAFAADALGTTVGAALGTSTVTSYIESATGVEEGGRTGLTALVVAVLFLLALFFTPLLAAMPPVATAPALILVGALMFEGAREIEWTRIEEALPAFFTIAAMPLTFSIANGIALGIASHTLLRLLTGRWREVHPVMVVLTAALAAYYGFLQAATP
jgi:AGZA family xanthine/uracil permease-like MFS transporter